MSPDHELARTDEPDRRDFLSKAASISMAGGLVSGYGALACMAVRFVYPADRAANWVLVSDVRGVLSGASIDFEFPSGLKVTIKRTASADASRPATESDFIALSSVCPHLGCRVHWEAANDRFFCPCHNGEFDPEGKATGGPPKAANQHLPRYPLKVENGLLFIEIPPDSLLDS